jgi:hypothetical protein
MGHIDAIKNANPFGEAIQIGHLNLSIAVGGKRVETLLACIDEKELRLVGHEFPQA